MNITFHNVAITITANNPKDAYKRLSNLLSKDDITFLTDIFTLEDEETDHDTATIIPLEEQTTEQTLRAKIEFDKLKNIE